MPKSKGYVILNENLPFCFFPLKIGLVKASYVHERIKKSEITKRHNADEQGSSEIRITSYILCANLNIYCVVSYNMITKVALKPKIKSSLGRSWSGSFCIIRIWFRRLDFSLNSRLTGVRNGGCLWW